ncbi:hypothetical protein [Gellertiella hungarica]|uniref:Uncharacterized protein n=1 Tax=Gellertiella hungarica TaxID=1572859 RepID=A0A7W6J4B8_9HYPH|nr:hypothetical protein [Gellertiella hungarica]MBB4063666.1 hypothetical protein [Gellertiella hungarica]
MTPEQIEKLFVTAAEIERKLPPMGERPARLKAQAIPFMLPEGEAKPGRSLRPREVSHWELCNELMRFVPRERDRRCLWAWAMGEAGTLRDPASGERLSFSRWCDKVEGIHRNTGSHRQKVAIACIAAIFLRNTLADIRKLQKEALQNEPEISDKSANMNEPREWSWRAPGAFTAEAVPEARDFSWAEQRNEMRRKREAAAR